MLPNKLSYYISLYLLHLFVLIIEAPSPNLLRMPLLNLLAPQNIKTLKIPPLNLCVLFHRWVKLHFKHKIYPYFPWQNCASTKCPIPTFRPLPGIVTAASISLTSLGSDLLATPPYFLYLMAPF